MKFRILTEETVKELTTKISLIKQEIVKNYAVEFRMRVESKDRGSKEKNRVFIEFIKALKPGQGAFAMQRLCDWADENEIVLALRPSEDFGSNKEKLIAFYSKFGFVPIVSEMERRR